MDKLENTKPIKNKPKIRKDQRRKIFDQRLNFLQSQVQSIESPRTENNESWKIQCLQNRFPCDLMTCQWKWNATTQNNFFYFLHHMYFWSFLIPRYEQKLAKKTNFERFETALLFFHEKFYLCRRVLDRKVRVGYYKFGFTGSEDFKKVFGSGVFEKILVAKIEGNCIYVVIISASIRNCLCSC